MVGIQLPRFGFSGENLQFFAVQAARVPRKYQFLYTRRRIFLPVRCLPDQNPVQFPSYLTQGELLPEDWHMCPAPC